MPKKIVGVLRPNLLDRNSPVGILSLGSLTRCRVIQAEQNEWGYKAETNNLKHTLGSLAH